MANNLNFIRFTFVPILLLVQISVADRSGDGVEDRKRTANQDRSLNFGWETGADKAVMRKHDPWAACP